MKGKSYFFSLIFLLSTINTAFASGFQLLEMATPSTATAGVGQAAYANDASTAFLNPAGMSLLGTSQMLVGTQLFFPDIRFAQSVANTIPGGNGEKNNLLLPGGGIYFVSNLSERLSAGISLASPYGGMVDYGDAYAGRYLAQKAELIFLDLTPVVSYKINALLSVGGGFSVQYTTLHESIALPLPGFLDGQIILKVSDFAPGFNLGLLFTPLPTTRLGLAFRSQIKHTLTGNTYFNRLSFTPTSSAAINTPNSLIASGYHELTERLALVGEVGWTNWQEFENTVVKISGFTSTTPRNWKNAYRFGLGGNFKVTPKIKLMSGISYDNSPNDISNRLPDFPLDRQVRYAMGALYTNSSQTQFGFQYEFVDYGNAKMFEPGSQGIFSGELKKNHGQFISLTMNAHLD
ncbi:MAG: outer membrane protein transport protein [Tatlockia sp.]|jgi:long-chain fatty acid transport protein